MKAEIPISLDDSFGALIPEASPAESQPVGIFDIYDADPSFAIPPVPETSPDYGASEDQSRSTSTIGSSFVIAPTPERGLRHARLGNRQNQTSRQITEVFQPASTKALPPLPERPTERGAMGACVDTFSQEEGLKTRKPRRRTFTAKERQGGISSPKPLEPVSRITKPRTRASRTTVNAKHRTRVSKRKRDDSSALKPACGVAGDGEYEICRIVGHRSTAHGDEYEVVWKNTWVSAGDLRGARETLQNFKAERFGKSKLSNLNAL